MVKFQFVLLLLVNFLVIAKDLGEFGVSFPIIEEDLQVVIHKKLQTMQERGLLANAQQQVQEKVVSKIKRPMAVKGIDTTTHPRIFLYDPSLVVPYDLKDQQGRVFHKAGTKINPLDLVKLKQALLFINGDDVKQVNWGLAQKQAKIILVQGAPLDLAAKHQKIFYFDQQGILVKKFGIQQVPARVSQLDRKLKVEELYLLEPNR